MDLRDILFRIRGFTPIPFLVASLIWAKPHCTLIAIGGMIAILGEMLRIYALRHAGGATRTRDVGAPGLVSSGPYAHTRNPLYLANMMLYCGFAVASGALSPYLPAAAFLFFAWQYGMIISLEEGTLKKLFGEEYAAYCKAVPRLWPSFSNQGKKIPAPYTLLEALREERSTILGLVFSWALLAIRLIYCPPAC